MTPELEQGIFQGQVIQGLKDLTKSVDEVREDVHLLSQETYKRINRNSLDIARQKGWLAALTVVAGIAGILIKVFWG